MKAREVESTCKTLCVSAFTHLILHCSIKKQKLSEIINIEDLSYFYCAFAE